MLQVGEASFFTYHPVVEAHVRVYAVLHEEARTQGASGDLSVSRLGSARLRWFRRL